MHQDVVFDQEAHHGRRRGHSAPSNSLLFLSIAALFSMLSMNYLSQSVFGPPKGETLGLMSDLFNKTTTRTQTQGFFPIPRVSGTPAPVYKWNLVPGQGGHVVCQGGELVVSKNYSEAKVGCIKPRISGVPSVYPSGGPTRTISPKPTWNPSIYPKPSWQPQRGGDTMVPPPGYN